MKCTTGGVYASTIIREENIVCGDSGLAHLYVLCKGGNVEVGCHSFSLHPGKAGFVSDRQRREANRKIPAQGCYLVDNDSTADGGHAYWKSFATSSEDGLASSLS